MTSETKIQRFYKKLNEETAPQLEKELFLKLPPGVIISAVRNKTLPALKDKGWSRPKLISITIELLDNEKISRREGCSYVKRGLHFSIHEESVLEKKFLFYVHAYHSDEALLISNYDIVDDLTLEDITSEYTVNSIGNWIKDGLLPVDSFFKLRHK
ncbi:MAG: hypothetical protein JWM20_30 [Patescibacteria group bacterium]|nr:hypothetical protein [Patescibacteria group bacterium]